MKNAASRPGHGIGDSHFKQPHFRVLAAPCVRALLFPSRERREGMERWEAPGCLRSTLGGGINVPTSHGKAPCAPKARRSASQRSTNHRAVDHSGAPRSGQLSLCPLKGSLLESGPSSNRTRNIYNRIGIASIGILGSAKIVVS